MNHLSSIDTEAFAASRLTGAEALFLDVLEAVIREHLGAASRAALSQPAARFSEADGLLLQRLLPFRAEFRLRYAAILERHLGAAGAQAVVVAFRSPPLQRYVAARRAMVPELALGLQRIVRRMRAIGPCTWRCACMSKLTAPVSRASAPTRPSSPR